MAISVVSTVGAANANSYVAVSDIDNFALITMDYATWAGVTDPDMKARYAVIAARLLDQIVAWCGGATTITQSMQWPRNAVEIPADVNYYLGYLYGNFYPNDQIPMCVKNAQCQLAVWLATQGTANPFNAPDSAGLDELSVGPIDIKFSANATSDGMAYFNAMIMPMLQAGGVIDVGSRLVR